VLGPHIHQAIEESQLRKWEVNNFLVKTTDCIVIDISRGQPNNGVMRLSVGSSYSVYMASKIFSVW
jgi:hypothetical protein